MGGKKEWNGRNGGIGRGRNEDRKSNKGKKRQEEQRREMQNEEEGQVSWKEEKREGEIGYAKKEIWNRRCVREGGWSGGTHCHLHLSEAFVARERLRASHDKDVAQGSQNCHSGLRRTSFRAQQNVSQGSRSSIQGSGRYSGLRYVISGLIYVISGLMNVVQGSGNVIQGSENVIQGSEKRHSGSRNVIQG